MLTIFLIFISSTFVYAQETNYGSNWDTVCEGSSCTAQIYSYDKYWKGNNGRWGEIDESFSQCSESEITKYCTRDYYYRAEARADGTITAFRHGQSISMKLIEINGATPTFTPSMRENSIFYSNVINDVDVRYHYLPTLLKEEIVINNPLGASSQEGINLVFSKEGDADFTILPPFICDAKGLCLDLVYENTGSNITVHVPTSFLAYPDIQYPLIIDPSLSLDSSAILWNGYIINRTNATTSTYTRTNNPSTYLQAGELIVIPSDLGRMARANIDWNISSISDSSAVQSVNLELFLTTASPSSQNVYLGVTPMEGWSGSYSDTTPSCQGNCQFYNDMGNASFYSENGYQTLEFIDIPLSEEAGRDFEKGLTSDRFSTGFVGFYTTGKEVRIAGKDDTNVSRRPKLVVVYGANNSEGDLAIEQGINASLPNNFILNNRQVYLFNQLGEQYLGNFNRATVLNNQTWVFNYIITGESFTNMPSLFRILNVWENQSITYSEIVNQVSAFINATKF